MKTKQVGYLNLIFVVLSEDKKHLYFINDEKKKLHPVQKRWGTVINDMEAGRPYCVATSVTPSESASGTSWTVLGVLCGMGISQAKEFNEAYWSELAGNPSASTQRKTDYAISWAEFLLNMTDAKLNNRAYRLMKLFDDPTHYDIKEEKKECSLFEF